MGDHVCQGGTAAASARKAIEHIHAKEANGQ